MFVHSSNIYIYLSHNNQPIYIYLAIILYIYLIHNYLKDQCVKANTCFKCGGGRYMGRGGGWKGKGRGRRAEVAHIIFYFSLDNIRAARVSAGWKEEGEGVWRSSIYVGRGGWIELREEGRLERVEVGRRVRGGVGHMTWWHSAFLPFRSHEINIFRRQAVLTAYHYFFRSVANSTSVSG